MSRLKPLLRKPTAGTLAGTAEIAPPPRCCRPRVTCRNRFGHPYMTLIAAAHRRYIAPSMLRAAAEALLLPVAEHAGMETPSVRA